MPNTWILDFWPPELKFLLPSMRYFVRAALVNECTIWRAFKGWLNEMIRGLTQWISKTQAFQCSEVGMSESYGGGTSNQLGVKQNVLFGAMQTNCDMWERIFSCDKCYGSVSKEEAWELTVHFQCDELEYIWEHIRGGGNYKKKSLRNFSIEGLWSSY